MCWTGVISTAVSFDRERQREYTLSVTATDQAQEPLIGICQITVLITDQNDNDPKFENSRYQCKNYWTMFITLMKDLFKLMPMLQCTAYFSDVKVKAFFLDGYIGMLWHDIFQNVLCSDRICWRYLWSVRLPWRYIKEWKESENVVPTHIVAVDSLNIYTWTFSIALNGRNRFCKLNKFSSPGFLSVVNAH